MSHPFHIILHQPEIAGNVGAVMRSAACFNAPLHAIEPLGFPLDKKALRRAAMDYGSGADLIRHTDWDAYTDANPTARRVLMTTRGATDLQDFTFAPGDHLIFGSESSGVPDSVHAASDARILIPITGRSLNLSNSVAITLFEALRQTNALATRTA